MNDDGMDSFEIDLEIADIGEILERHEIKPTAELVTELWLWAETKRKQLHHEDE